MYSLTEKKVKTILNIYIRFYFPRTLTDKVQSQRIILNIQSFTVFDHILSIPDF